MSEARTRRLGLEVKLCASELEEVELLNATYCAKELEYKVVGYRQLPRYAGIVRTARRLCEGLHPFVVRVAGIGESLARLRPIARAVGTAPTVRA